MRSVFVDTSFYIALFSQRDNHHDSAVALGQMLRSEATTFTTTDAVLVEYLTHVGRFGKTARQIAAADVDRVLADRRVTVLPQSRPLFLRALDLYGARLDKRYSMTDCMSFVVCRDRGIEEVLTADRDFEREGFRILLRP